MKLLLEKKGNRGSRIGDGITIKKTSVYITGSAFDRLAKKDHSIFGNIGINDEGNLALYIAYESNEYLYTFYASKRRDRQVRFAITSKEQRDAVSPYVGNYEIKYVSLTVKNGITEVVLQKKGNN